MQDLWKVHHYNLTEGIHEIKCKDWGCFLEYESVEGNLIKDKFLSSNKDCSNKLDKALKKKFKNTFKFSNNDINKFILLLRKGIYPYEYMEQLNYGRYDRCRLHVWKKSFKDFEIKNLGKHQDLYLKVIHYFWLMFLKRLEKCVQKFINCTLQNFFQLLD